MGLEAVSLPVFLKTCSDGPSHSLFYDGSHHPCEIKYLSLMMICLAGIMCLLVTSSVWKWTTGHALALEPYEKSKVYMCCYCYTGIQSYRRPLKSYPPSFLFTLFWDTNMSTLYCRRPAYIYIDCVVNQLSLFVAICLGRLITWPMN